MPSEAEIKLGFTCNNNCRFCLNADKKKLGDLSTEEIKSKILEARASGSNTISFTGGEPTIRDDFFELCWFVKQIGLNLIIHSNGRMFSYKKFAKQISDLDIEHFLISIHSNNSKVQNFLTQSKGFEQTTAGIKNLVKLGNTVITNTIINKYNMKNLKDTAEMLFGFGVERVQLTWPEPMGAALHNFDEIIPKFSEASNFIKEALKNRDNICIASIPICVVGANYKKFYVRHKEKKDFELYGTFESTKKIQGAKTGKFSCCKGCKMQDICEGVFKIYAKRYGSGEIKAI